MEATSQRSLAEPERETIELPAWREETTGTDRRFVGHYAVDTRDRLLLFRGVIVERSRRSTAVFLCQPPIWLAGHPIYPCLQLYQPASAWFKLHWHMPAESFTEALAFMEFALQEAWEATHES